MKKLTLLFFAALLLPASAQASEPRTDDHACSQCHSGVVEARKLAPDVHQDLTCDDCHPGRGNPHATPELGAELGAIAATLGDDTAIEATTLAACTKCHSKETSDWWASVHGPLSPKEVHGEQPDCLTCHGSAHNMPESFSAKMDIVVQCAQCHGFAGEEGKPHTNPYVIDMFRDTIHGRLLRLGNDESATCTDCHGVHGVRAEDDPLSMIHADNRAKTCGQCHEGASASFSRAVSHEPPLVDHNTWAWVFTIFFSILTFGTIGLLIVHVLLDLFRSLRPGGHDAAAGLSAKPKAPLHRDDEVKRFDIHARMQHWGMMLSFTTLVITGWPLKAAAVGQSSGLMEAMGGAATVGLIHRIAGGVLLAVAVYHVLYLIVGLKRKTLKLSMLPGPKDVRDIIGNIGYLLGLKKERPKFGRFTYYEKFDYWAVFWGMAIMGLSGLMLWFPVAFSSFLPGEAIELGRIAHSDEALLAALAIFLWHFYNVHLRPTIFPMSWVWITGRISAEGLYHEHREEYIARYGDVPPEDLEGDKPWHRRAAWSVVGLLAVLGIGVGVAVADMDAMRARIDQLVKPPPVPAQTIVPAAAEIPELDAVNRPEDPFGDCLTCHDKGEYAEGELFPHTDHFDDYFEDEIDDPQCTLCHEQAWHETKALKLGVCTDCHDADELEILTPPEEDKPADADGALPTDGGEGDAPAADEPVYETGDQAFLGMKCDKCHSVDDKSIPCAKPDKNKADLSEVTGDAEGLARYLQKDGTRKTKDGEDKTHAKGVKGSPENLKLLVDWLLN